MACARRYHVPADGCGEIKHPIFRLISLVRIRASRSNTQFSFDQPRSDSSRGKPLENVKDSLMVELLAKEALNEVNLCSTGTHQSPIDLPESGTKLDELPFFGWTNDESPANTVELIDNNAFQVMGTGSLPTPLLLFQYLREALRLSFNYFRSYCAGTGRWGTIHSPGS